MAIDDDPVKALQHQFELEDSSSSPVSHTILEALRMMKTLPAKLPWPLDVALTAIEARITRDAAHRVKVLLETIQEVLAAHTAQIAELKADGAERDQPSRAATELLIDAARRASETRSLDRVRRIGLILAHAIVEPRRIDEDEVEEMMRIAMELSDRDVEYLREFVQMEGDIIRRTGRVERYEAHTRWEQGWWGTRTDPEIDSVCSKLESYGLVSRIAPPNNVNLMADFQNRYVLLAKGLRFAELIQEQAATS